MYDAIETAEYFLRETNAQVNRYLNNIERTENEISSLYTKLENIKKEKIVKERELRETREKIEKLKMFQKNISLYSEYLRKWIHFISVTFGKTKILRTESTDLIFVDPLVTVIRDIATYIRKSSEDLSIYTDPRLKFAVEKFLLLSEYVKYQQTVSQYMWLSVVCLLSLYFISKIMPIIFFFFKFMHLIQAYHQYGVGSRPALYITKKDALDSQPQVIKFTSRLTMVGDSLRVLRVLPPLKLVAII